MTDLPQFYPGYHQQIDHTAHPGWVTLVMTELEYHLQRVKRVQLVIWDQVIVALSRHLDPPVPPTDPEWVHYWRELYTALSAWRVTIRQTLQTARDTGRAHIRCIGGPKDGHETEWPVGPDARPGHTIRFPIVRPLTLSETYDPSVLADQADVSVDYHRAGWPDSSGVWLYRWSQLPAQYAGRVPTPGQ